MYVDHTHPSASDKTTITAKSVERMPITVSSARKREMATYRARNSGKNVVIVFE